MQGARNIQGQEVLTASAPIAPLGWTMFVELPVEEAYASLYLALQRLAIVLLGALVFAVLRRNISGAAHGGPIQALRAGAERIGGGDFAQRISIKTGDELEGLADQFNDMGARLQESYTDLEKKVESRTAELSESLRAADRDSGNSLVDQRFDDRHANRCSMPSSAICADCSARALPYFRRCATTAWSKCRRWTEIPALKN